MEELFNLLTEDVVIHDYPKSKHAYIISGSYVKSNHADISMSANDHEDSRICLHVDDALNEGAITVLVKTRRHRRGYHLFGIFHDLTQQCSYRSALALESTSDTNTSTPFAKNLGMKKLVLCPFSRLLGF